MLYLQWYYTAAHVPITPLGAGVNMQVAPFATGLRDAGMWIVPSLMPLAIIVYTFGWPTVKRTRVATVTQVKTTVRVEEPLRMQEMQPAIAGANAGALTAGESAIAHTINCDECEWSGSYPTKRGATNALTAHRRHAHNVNAGVDAQ